jgi:hypothetical protein
MVYDYQTERPKLFTEEGMRILIHVRDAAKKLLAESGAFKAGKVFASGDGWTSHAALDYLVEIGEIRRIEQGGYTAGQDEVYTKS